MERVTLDIAESISQECGRETYFASPFWLAENCSYERKNGELLLYVHDRIDGETRLLFPPKLLPANEVGDIEAARDEDVELLQARGVSIREKIELGNEYIFRAEAIAQAVGGGLASFRRNANYFRNHYAYTLHQEYPASKVRAFIETWAATKDISTYSGLAQKIFRWDLDNCLHYAQHTRLAQNNLYVEIDGGLAGFAFTHPLSPRMFVGLMQKVDIRYRGISPFLYQEKSKLYPGVPYFTIGTAAATPGLEKFKDSMQPDRKIPTYLLKINH